MTVSKLFTACMTALFLAGCNAVDIDMRKTPPTAEALARDYRVSSLNITVPRELSVSEANLYYPAADIVWRGEPQGDRYAQVERIFRDSMGFGISQLRGQRAVVVDVEVTRFHALTEKARYSISFGGVNSIKFWMTVHDASTGAVIEPRRFVEADFTALQGERALEAEAEGLTERVQISRHLAGVIQRELMTPTAWTTAKADMEAANAAAL